MCLSLNLNSSRSTTTNTAHPSIPSRATHATSSNATHPTISSRRTRPSEASRTAQSKPSNISSGWIVVS
ncbi:hypothetical protein CC86DRAFT_371754 [Ophiobolus disseminans]|uniref:Uncharacterized protein n=1 Tax=Ophiobolus disseminans TaxID=1469910 RepID=A0A6A6ZTL5_9PLEO|nr:hypothetical protein CC86DRAFT_371754 [Ophiobolus disseminans]